MGLRSRCKGFGPPPAFLLAALVLFGGVPLLLFTIQAREQSLAGIETARQSERRGHFILAARQLAAVREKLSGPMKTLFAALRLLHLPLPTERELLHREAELWLAGASALLHSMAENPEPLRQAARCLNELPDRGRAGALDRRLRILQRLQLAQTRHLEGEQQAALALVRELKLSDSEEDRSYAYIGHRLRGTIHYRLYREQGRSEDLRAAYLAFGEAFAIDPEDRLAARDYRFVEELAERLPPVSGEILLNSPENPPITEGGFSPVPSPAEERPNETSPR